MAGLTYKPDFAFEVYEDRFEGLHVAIRADVEDALHPGQSVVLDIARRFLPSATGRRCSAGSSGGCPG